MYSQVFSKITQRGFAACAAALLLGSGLATAAEPDATLAGYLGREITLDPKVNELMPANGKITFVHDSEKDVVRVCTRTAPDQQGTWKADLAPGCNLEMKFTRGERFCTLEDVKAGDAEVLASCHRMRSQDVALNPAPAKGTTERHDLLVFPVVSAQPGILSIYILVDSPSRLTGNGGGSGGHTKQ